LLQAEVNGVNLFYDRLGIGEPLVLIHGLGERIEGWEFQRTLAEHFELIIPDLRGFGKTRAPQNQDITINAMAQDIVALLDHLSIRKAHILGFSMGGMVAQEIYKINPEKIDTLILASTLFYVPKWLKKLLLLSNKRIIHHLTVEKFKAFATSKCLYDKSNEHIQKVMPIWSDHLDGFLPGLMACFEIDYRKTLKKITVPTLVISCNNDRICLPFNQIIMHKLIPSSNLYRIKEAGHMGKIEKSEEFNSAVINFLNNVSA